MIPEKFIADVKSSRKRRRALQAVVSAAVFSFGMYLLGPFVHEISHVAWIEFQGCFYTFETGLSPLIGFYGSVQPACSLEDASLAFFFMSGYLATLSLSLSLDAVADRLDSSYGSYLASGVAVSVLLTITAEGDTSSLAEAFGLGSGFALGLSALIALAAGALSYRSLRKAETPERPAGSSPRPGR